MKSHMIGRLGLSLLALGVIPMTPSRAPAAVDPRAVEHALDALSAAGISAPERLSSGRLAKRAPPRPVVSTGFDGQAEILGAMLHPCGYCCCGGDGVCQWCVMNAKREADEAAAEERHKAVCELRRQNRRQQASARKARQGKKSRRGF